MVSKVTIGVTALSTDPIYAQADTSLQDIQKIIKITDNTPNGPDLVGGDDFGISIASIGDLNGNGVNDLAVGAGGGNDVHIIFMNSDNSLQDTVRINGDTPNGPSLDDDDRLGRSVASIGDLNSDGMNDLAIGASGNDAGRGAVHIILYDYSVTECYKILLGLA